MFIVITNEYIGIDTKKHNVLKAEWAHCPMENSPKKHENCSFKKYGKGILQLEWKERITGRSTQIGEEEQLT